MRPRLTPNRPSNVGVVDAVLGSELRIRRCPCGVFGANRPHGVSGEFGKSLPLTASQPFRVASGTIRVSNRYPVSPAALGIHVGHVVGIGSEEQVARVRTRRVVARMKDIESVRDRANELGVGHATRNANACPATARADASVSLLIDTTRPTPTGVRIVRNDDKAQESFVKGYLCGHHRASNSVIVPGAIPVAARRFCASNYTPNQAQGGQ
jgi:hypothetical protein